MLILAFRCVAFDGTRWSQQCAVGAYSSSNNYMTCTCNATASILAIAAAEFIIDCSGTLGGSLVLDACKTCGGSISDASKCSDNAAASNNGAIIGGAVGGCVALVIIVFGIWHKRRRDKTVSPVDRNALDVIHESKDSAYVTACIVVANHRADRAAGSTNFQNESQGVEPENLRRANESALREIGRLNAALAQPQSFVPAELLRSPYSKDFDRLSHCSVSESEGDSIAVS